MGVIVLCNSTLCRQVFMTLDGMVGVYNISTGYAFITITGRDDVDIGIVSNVAYYSDWFPLQFQRLKWEKVCVFVWALLWNHMVQDVCFDADTLTV